MTKPGFVEVEAARCRTCQVHQTRSREEIRLSKVSVEKLCDESAMETLAIWMIEQDVVDKRSLVDDDGTVHMYYYLTAIMPPRTAGQVGVIVPAKPVLSLVPPANDDGGKDDE